MMRWVVIALFGGVAASLVATNGDPAAPHERFGQGDCASCHERAPGYHLTSGWPLTHGRTEPQLADRCGTCHAPDTCTACHERPPATHTMGFRSPGSDSLDGERHARLAQVAPSSCLVCHRSFARDCTRCHALDEVTPWAARGGEALARWRTLVGEP